MLYTIERRTERRSRHTKTTGTAAAGDQTRLTKHRRKTNAQRQAGNEAMNNTSDDRHTDSERDTKNKKAAETQPQGAAAAEEQTLALARETNTQETLAMAKEEREREKEKRHERERERERKKDKKIGKTKSNNM
jgi:hypothetical protein